MRNLILLAGALGVLAIGPVHAADVHVDDPQYGTAQPAIDDAHAAGMWAEETDFPENLRVMGVLSEPEVAAMRAAHDAAGLTLSMSVVPAGGINAGKFYVTGTLTPELLAQMDAAHSGSNLDLDLRAMPVAPSGVVMGDTRVRIEEHAEHDPRGYLNENVNEHVDIDVDGDGDIDTHFDQRAAAGYDQTYQPARGDRAARREARREARQAMQGDWHGGPGWYGPHGEHGDHGKWRGKRGVRGNRGWRGANYDIATGCSHWERDWHQDGCGTVHVHNLADWLPNHIGWNHGWHYAGWDDDSWPHVRNDGSHVWYTGQFWREANIKVTPPAWYDAQWVMFGDAYPDTWWLSTWQGHGWSWDGHGWARGGKHRGGCGCNKCGHGGRWR